MTPFDLPLNPALLDRLKENAEAADHLADWPHSSWEALRSAGVLACAVPREYGGAGLDPVSLLGVNEALASACLTTTFALSQRDAAIRLLLTGPDHLRQRFLPGLASGELFLTVGLSQLTTSRSRPSALRATPTATGLRFDGEIPWVTGADRAAALVIGAPLEDGRQVLMVLPTDRPGVTISPPYALSALQGARTSVVACEGVELEPDLVLAGPVPQVLGRSGGGGLDTSCLAIGLTAAAEAFLANEARSRPELQMMAERVSSARMAARGRLHQQALAPPDPDAVLALRVECTRLVLRATQAALVAAKGAGFVTDHPAQRWARQALFFLVWSCPRSVVEGVLADLLP